ILAQKGGARLYSQLSALYDTLQDADGPVTQGIREVYAEQAKEMKLLQGEQQQLLGDLSKLNDLARKLDLPTIFPGGREVGKGPNMPLHLRIKQQLEDELGL